MPGARSRFWICARSQSDPAFPRYPALPVLRCPGYEEGAVGRSGGAPPAPTTPGADDEEPAAGPVG